ncbi:MAG: hypothetical protein HQK54_11130, partial [Oligoflexales bacterium]|nr:hypothetical protein [Oligoflexales bacterium]
MSGLFHTLGIGAESLFTSRQGVDTAGHNIANAQTEGYSRQRVNVTERDPSETRGVIIGNGVYAKNISRAHDKYIEREIVNANQTSGRNNTKFELLKTIEGIYSPELNSSPADELTKFFASLQDLSVFPEELIVRTNVKETAGNLVKSFHRLDFGLRNSQNDINERLSGE